MGKFPGASPKEFAGEPPELDTILARIPPRPKLYPVKYLRCRLFRSCLLLAFAAWAAPGAAASATATAERRLDNGLRVIVKPDRRAPVVIAMLWYKVGSIDEVTGNTGIAHVLEHMAFKGTPTVGNGEYTRLISEAGGN